MTEEIIIINVVNIKDGESKLSFHNDGEDVITLKLDGNEICRMDYNYNLAPIIERMLEIWGKGEE